MTESTQTSPPETWTSILKEARDARSRFEENETADTSVLDIFQSRFPAWKDQLLRYASEFSRPKRNDNQQPTEPLKELILETRAALRFGLLLFSFENDDVRLKMQNVAVLECQWHVPLVSLLSQRRCDSKCRLFSARLLSNLVTSNSDTAAALSSVFPISPSKDWVSSAILQDLSATEESSDDNTSMTVEPNWVDMLLSSAKSGNREAIAGITAALHNCIVSLKSRNCLPDEENSSFVRDVASNSMLLSTFLRYFISADTVTNSLKTNDDDSEEKEVDPWDSATHWIYLLLTRLGRLGLLPSMYSAISGRDPTKTEDERSIVVLPEQNVLLHCMVKEAGSFVIAHISDPDTTNPFGGEIGWEATAESYDYLVGLFSRFCHSIFSCTNRQEMVDNSDILRVRSGLISILDILADTLGVDSPVSTKLRDRLGTKTALLQESAKALGTMVDDLTERSIGRKARELKISEDEQKLITNLVRLQGNHCFNCRHNQDLMRTTLVPLPTKKDVAAESDKMPNPSRNALHVLLTCTSFGTSCFTLREWCVIAIRNVLENNSDNQDVVAQLDAQNTVQSAALDSAGVRVTMDQKGKVSLSTLDENEDET